MDADLDLLLTTVYVTADDLLPESTKNVMRRVTDAEVVTLALAQAIMGIPSDRRFLAVATKRLGHLFPVLPKQSGYFKRRARLTESLEWLMGMFASQSPGFQDDLVLVDSTPVECARSRETVKRSALGDAADYGYCAAIPGTSGGSGCTRSSARTAHPARWSCAPQRSTSATSLSGCLNAAAVTGTSRCSETRATPAESSRPLSRT